MSHRRLAHHVAPIAVIMTGLVSIVPPAFADPGNAYCADYAQQAVRAAQIARDKRCAEVNSHDFWSTDYNRHYIWCRGLSSTAPAAAGSQQRNNLALQCRPR